MAINLTTKYAKKTVDKFYQESVIAGSAHMMNTKNTIIAQ